MVNQCVAIFIVAFLGLASCGTLHESLPHKWLLKIKFVKHPEKPVFAFEFKTDDGQLHQGWTYLIDHRHPHVQHLDLKHELFPDHPLTFEVKFSPKELQLLKPFDKAVQLVHNKSNARNWGMAMKFLQFFMGVMKNKAQKIHVPNLKPTFEVD